jgi:hypothetical protein
MHDPVFGSLANCTVGCKPDIIFAAHLADRMLESILTLAVAPTVRIVCGTRQAQQETAL